MRKKIVSIVLVACMLLIVAFPVKANASTATKEVQEGKTYKVDLDGNGKKEELRFATKKTGSKSTLRIYINGKKMTSYSYQNNDNWVGQIGYTDLNKKDKYKEVFFEIVSDSACFEHLEILRYQKGKLTSICKENYTDLKELARWTVSLTQKGDGTVTITADTPFHEMSLGSYYADMTYKIKKGKLVKASQSTYYATKSWKKQKYTLTKNITFTTTPGGSKKAYSAKKGSVVYLNRLYCKSFNGRIYIEMKNKAGKTGWMKVTKSKFYKEEYGWG